MNVDFQYQFWNQLNVPYRSNLYNSVILFALKFLVHDSTEYIADIATATGKIGHRPSADACHWTTVDVDGISADRDTKISASAHLCE